MFVIMFSLSLGAADVNVEDPLLLALLDTSEEGSLLGGREPETGDLVVGAATLGLVSYDLEYLAVGLEARVQELVVDPARLLVVLRPLEHEERVLVARGVPAPIVGAEG